MTERKSHWLDTADGKVETYDYTPLTTGETVPLDDYRPRTTTITLAGNVSSKSYFSAFFNGSGEYVEISEQASSTTVAFGAASNFSTTTTYYAPTDSVVARRGRVKSVVRYDGTGSDYDYATGTTSADKLIVTNRSSLDSSLGLVAGFSSRTITDYDVRGDLTESTSGIVPLAATAFTNYQKTTHQYNALGYKEGILEEDLLTNRLHKVAECTWTNGRKTASTDASGTDYTHGYDDLDRQTTTTRSAIAANSVYAAQSAITTTTTGTMRKTGDSVSWQNKTTTIVGGGITLTTSTERDVRGRLSESTDENGYITNYNINTSGTSTITTYPNGELSTTLTFLDGRHKSTTGAAVTPSFTSYSPAANGEMITTRFTLTSGDDRYATVVTNMLGQNIRTLSPALSGLAATTITNTNFYQSGTGYLLRSSSNATNVPDMVMEYNSIGVLTRRGQSQDDTLTLASDDRITDISTGVELDGGDLWAINEATVYPTLNSAATKLVSTSRSQIAGFIANEMSRSESNDINGNLSHQRSLLVLGSGGIPTGVSASVSDSAATSSIAFAVAYHGRVGRAQTPGVTGVTTYAYDGLGRTILVKDPRHTGDSDTVYFANSSQVQKSINAKGEETIFAYFGNGVLGAGRVSTTTLPDMTLAYSSYDTRGRTVATWGSLTYTRWYEYDDYNQMTELHTWQADPGLTLATISNGRPAGSAKTAWTHDAATGLLLTKRDADTKGNDYQYDTAGRLAKRTNARLVVTDYDYTVWGELSDVDYSNDVTETRPLDYDYDRLGRLDLVTQTGTTMTPGTNSHDFVYNSGNLLLDKETIDYGSSFTRILDHTQDAFLRPQQHKLLDGSTIKHLVDIAYYGTDGQLGTVTDNTDATAEVFTYDYENANNRLLKTVVSPVHTVTNSYEANRNILTIKKNDETVGTPDITSEYTYATNAIGQRESVARAGSAMSVANTIGWDHNSRGELKEEDFGNNGTAEARDRVFRYDAIGNRQKSAKGTLTPPTANYIANALNEYTSVDTNGTNISPVYDNDGNLTSGQLPKFEGLFSALTWDAENRLIKVVTSSGTTSYDYDYQGRRIAKTAFGSSAVTTRFIYHGWNLCAEYTGTALEKTYTWGMDLSGSMQGAGGVGGLLMVTEDPGGTSEAHFYPSYDGNGNVSEYLSSTGATVAHYEYDAFGNEAITPTGSKASDFAHRFSTKYLDDETGLYYYGYRYCAPSEAWHLLRGESPRRKFLKGESWEGQGLATRFVASLAGVKERRKRMNDTTEA